MKKLWSDSECDLLRELYEIDGLSLSELTPIFNELYNRGEIGIGVKIGKLKLRHTNEQKFNIKSRLNSGINNNMYGKVSWAKGLTKENSKKIRDKSILTSKTRLRLSNDNLLPNMFGVNNPMFGKKPWNSGLTKYDDDRLMYGDKISLIRKLEWENKTESERLIVIKRLNDAMISIHKPTRSENKIELFLKSEQFTYQKNYRLGNFIFDFYLNDYNLLIETDGDYWHANPKFYRDKKLTSAQEKNIERDSRKNKLVKTIEPMLLRFWEDDIINNFNFITNKILYETKKY